MVKFSISHKVWQQTAKVTEQKNTCPKFKVQDMRLHSKKCHDVSLHVGAIFHAGRDEKLIFNE